MTRKKLLRPVVPITLLSAWIVSPAVRQAHSLEIVCAMLLMAMASACLEKPFRMERLAARLLILLVLWPTDLTRTMNGYIGSYNYREVLAFLTVVLFLYLAFRFILIWRRLPKSKTRTSIAFHTLSPGSMELARTELALLWFGLFRWRRRDADRPSSAAAFPMTNTSNELAICWLTAFGFVIETPLFHVLLAHVWNIEAAWACTGLHALLGLYLIGYAKSLSFRPTLLFADRLEIRLGVVARRIILRSDIDHLSLYQSRRARQPDEQRLFGFEEPNLRLSANGLHILFRVDEPTRLMTALA
ncbi:MAG: hypothetical protein ACRYGI_04045 [Janthinobacterium lividum]